MSHSAEIDAPCRHCGKTAEADGDHTCTCPHPDDFCPDHPRPEDPWNTVTPPTASQEGRAGDMPRRFSADRIIPPEVDRPPPPRMPYALRGKGYVAEWNGEFYVFKPGRTP